MPSAESVASLTNKEIAALCYQDVKQLVPGLRLGADRLLRRLDRAPTSAGYRRTRRRYTVQDRTWRRRRGQWPESRDLPPWRSRSTRLRPTILLRACPLSGAPFTAAAEAFARLLCGRGHQRIYTPQFILLYPFRFVDPLTGRWVRARPTGGTPQKKTARTLASGELNTMLSG